MELKTYRLKDIKKCLQFKEVSGVYALIHDNEIIYVGQSKDVRSRLMAHSRVKYQIKFYSKPTYKGYQEGRVNNLKKYLYIRDNMDEILFLVLPASIDELNELEKHYINKYKPKFNYAGIKREFLQVKRSA